MMLSARRLSYLLGNSVAVDELVKSGSVSPTALDALAALAQQAIWMGIDYKTLGLGWDHPRTRTEYRGALHPSTSCKASRNRAALSRRRLVSAVSTLKHGCQPADAEAAIVELFLEEIGAGDSNTAAASAVDVASFDGVRHALEAELLLPLRALNECETFMLQTYGGDPVPEEPVRATLQKLIEAVLSGPSGFADWRYENAVGVEQLRGLSPEQLDAWRFPLSINHEDCEDVQTHEDGEGELGFFWATKIGGPSHGFDYEAQCLLPLLSNARHKVVLASIPSWPAHPVARAHFRVLWTADLDGSVLQNPQPRLWLEAVNLDFAAEESEIADKRVCTLAVFRHAIMKSEEMQVPLSVSDWFSQPLSLVADKQGFSGIVQTVEECLTLRPSNGVIEASDYLSFKHDWVQFTEEVTEPLCRALYVPASCSFEVSL